MSVRLDEFDKAEWFDVARRLVPDITEEQYEQMWQECLAMKEERQRLEKLQ